MTEISELIGKGFNIVLKSDKWQIASITYDTQYMKENFDHMKRHLTTDEVFIPIKGTATLYTFEDGKMDNTDFEIGKTYCVKKGVWHYLCVSEDSLIAVAENTDLLPQDTERCELECLMQK